MSSVSKAIRWVCLGLLLFTTSTANAVIAPLFYDPSTGNLAMDVTNTLGGVMGGYVLKSPTSSFVPAGHTPFLSSPLVMTLTSEVSESNPFGNLPGGVYSVGNVLPTGLTESQAANALVLGSAIWVGGLGTPTGSFELIYGPSPYPALNDPNAPPPVFDWATEATLIYNQLTGNVTIDLTGPNGGAIASYELDSAPGSFNAAAFTPAGTLGYYDAFPDHIIEAEYGGIANDIYDLGPILAPGMDIATLETHLTSAKFITAPGHGVTDFDIETSGIGFTLQIVGLSAPAVPEPSTYLLAACGLIGLVALGRRRRR